MLGTLPLCSGPGKQYCTGFVSWPISQTPLCRNQDDYEVLKKVGRGKYSEVFEGINVKSQQKCIIKILKPVKKKKVSSQHKSLVSLCLEAATALWQHISCGAVLK